MIHRFLNGEMGEEELRAFQKRIEAEEELAEQISELAVEVAEDLALKKRLNQFRPEPSVSWWTKPAYRVAASVAVVVVCAVLIFQMLGKGEPPLFDQYFQPYDEWSYMRGSGEQDLLWEKALRSYQQAAYAEGLALMKEVGPEASGNVPRYHLYMGITNLSLHPPESLRAIDQLKRVLSSENSFADPARWYLALAYLEASDTEAAKQHLQALIETESALYLEKATALLEQL